MPDNATTTIRPEAAAEAVKRLCLAESIGRIFSVNHPKGQAAVRGAFDAVTALLAEAGPVVFSLTDGRVLVGGKPVEDRNPGIVRFVAAFQQIHVDNLLFSPGLGYVEFEEFFRALLQGAKVVNEQGGLAALLKDKGVTHIKPQQVTFVMVREEEKVVPLAPALGPDETQPLPVKLNDEQLLRETIREVAGPAVVRPPRPRKPRARKQVVDTITQRLRERGLDDGQTTQLATQLSEFFERELNVRADELRQDNRRLTDELRDLNQVLDQMELAVVVWNPQGVVTFVHHSAVTMVGLVAGRALSPVAHQCLKTLTFPLLAPEQTLAEHPDLTQQDTILLRAVESVIALPDGTRIAALLRRA
jgi:PAS domain-containing protein